MFPVFESIAVMDGRYLNLPIHTRRVQRTARALWQLNFSNNYLLERLPVFSNGGLYKCRFFYHETDFRFDFQAYKEKVIHTLKLIEAPRLKYDYKWSNRNEINAYANGLPIGSEVLFTCEGYLTDTTYSNVALLRNKQWYTPETPLLQGTQRAVALENGLLKTTQIHCNDLHHYEQISLINALNPLGKIIVPTSAIV